MSADGFLAAPGAGGVEAVLNQLGASIRAKRERIEPKHRRTEQPIHRESREHGRFEGTWWTPFDVRQRGAIMQAAERHEQMIREPGQRAAKGALKRCRKTGQMVSAGGSTLARDVLRELMRLVDYRTGRLEPAIQTLCRRLKRSRGAIVRALAALKAWGFIDWIRRFEYTGDAGVRGPQVKQITNAYRILLPAWARKLLGPGFEDGPPPEDEDARTAEGRATKTRYQLEDPDDPLGAALGRLGRRVRERDSSSQDDSPLE